IKNQFFRLKNKNILTKYPRK
ncbi:hypothetical protein A5834_000700, partial [Enterococcus faecium]